MNLPNRLPGTTLTRVGSHPIRNLKIGLDDTEYAARRLAIGGSDANTIANGDPSKILELWAEKTGRAPRKDLSDVLPVAIGSVTEELNRYWFERHTGLQVIRDGERITHPEYPYLTATVDGITTTTHGKKAVFEAKHVNPFKYTTQKIVDRYMPQLHHNMYVAGMENAVLSVFIGTLNWECTWVEFDWLYHAELLQAERRFWHHVMENIPP